MTGAELKEWRKSRGLTLAFCAGKIGRVSVPSWKFWEDGRAGKEPQTVYPDVIERINIFDEMMQKLDLGQENRTNTA
jgi:transcriptional regulator with XRE-family HTH domain